MAAKKARVRSTAKGVLVASVVSSISKLSEGPRSTMLGVFAQEGMGPFQVLIATILSARAKDEVTSVIAKDLFKRFPDPASLARARVEEVIPIIRRIGFYNNKARMIIGAARMIRDDFAGRVPDTLEDLVKLPGVGRKVANCVLVYSFGKDAIPVDTHVHRLSNRLGWVRTKSPEETEQRLMRLVPQKLWQSVNDTLVWHGKTVCLPISPKCSTCVLVKQCKRVGVGVSR